MFSSCFPGARLDLSDEDNVVALALTKCSARSYVELIKSNIPSSSSLMSARSSASRSLPPFALGVSSFGPTAAAPTRGEILVHLGATSRKPRSAKGKTQTPLKRTDRFRPRFRNWGCLLILLFENRSRRRCPWPSFRIRARPLLLLPKSWSGRRHPWLRFRNWGCLLLLLPKSRSGRRQPWFCPQCLPLSLT